MFQGRSNPLERLQLKRGSAFGIMIVGALIAFEIFNYGTTDFALHDLLGNLTFAGMRWSTILALAFCGIDFAGIARIFTPEEGIDEPKEVWYLLGAWLLAATMNAMLTWWGVSIAILGHETLGNAVVDRATLLRVVPIFVAALVWLSRLLLIGTFSVAGERLFSQDSTGKSNYRPKPKYSSNGRSTQWTQPKRPQQRTQQPAFRPAPKPQVQRGFSSAAPPEPIYEPTYDNSFARPEPTYTPVSMSGRTNNNNNNYRR